MASSLWLQIIYVHESGKGLNSYNTMAVLWVRISSLKLLIFGEYYGFYFFTDGGVKLRCGVFVFSKTVVDVVRYVSTRWIELWTLQDGSPFVNVEGYTVRGGTIIFFNEASNQVSPPSSIMNSFLMACWMDFVWIGTVRSNNVAEG